MNMNAYNNYNNNFNNAAAQSQSQTHSWGRSGSRRNSIKGYAAPAPPPMPPIHMQRNDASRMNQTNQRMNPNQNYQQRNSFIPVGGDPVRELQDMVRSRSMDADNTDEPPFNFKAMLRKTNYPPRNESTTYDYNSRSRTDNMDMDNSDQQQQQHSFQAPKLRSTGRRFDQEDHSNQSHTSNFGAASKFGTYNRPPSLQQNSTSVGKSFDENSGAQTFMEAGSYVDEEIAPGVTLTGYAVDF